MKFVYVCLLLLSCGISAQEKKNVLFIISDDLSSRALPAYGNSQCKTPNIDRIVSQGTLFKNTYCQFPVCGASRASFMSGMYPHQTGVLSNNISQFEKNLGSRLTMTQNFMKHGYYAPRIGKMYHMLIPGNITEGISGPDHTASFSEVFNFKGDEWFSKGEAEALCKTKLNMDKTKHYALGFGGAFYAVKTPEGESQPDYRAASKAIEVIKNKKDKPFFISLGLIRPHVPLVAPKKYFDMYPPGDMILCKDTEEDLKDIPKAGHSKTTKKYGIEDEMTRKKILSAYYASVTFMDAQVGRVLDAIEREGLRENTIIVFTSDHGWHLGEHTFWQKVNLHEESAQVPLIISTPGQQPAVSTSMTELLDLYPTLSKQCGLNVPSHVMGKDITPIIKNPKASIREAAFCVTGKNKFMLRSKKWAFMQYGKNGEKGFELYDMKKDPGQHTNLAKRIEYKELLEQYKGILKKKMAEF